MTYIQRLDRFADFVDAKLKEPGWTLAMDGKTEASFYYVAKLGESAILVAASIDEDGKISITRI